MIPFDGLSNLIFLLLILVLIGKISTLVTDIVLLVSYAFQLRLYQARIDSEKASASNG